MKQYSRYCRLESFSECQTKLWDKITKQMISEHLQNGSMITGNQPTQKEQVMPDKLHSFTNKVTMKAVDNCITLAIYKATFINII